MAESESIGRLTRFALACLVCWVGSFLFGEELEDESILFRVLGYGPDFFDGIKFERETDEGAEIETLAFQPDRRSRVYRMPSSEASLTFFREEMSDEGDGLVRRLLGVVELEPDERELTLVFIEESESADEDSFLILPLNESEEVWGAGCFRFLNLSGAPLEMSLGELDGPLGQGISEVVRFKLSEPRELLKLRLSLQWEGRRQVIYSTRVLPDLRRGKLFVVKPPLEEGSLKIRVLPVR